MSETSCEQVLRGIELYVDGELDRARSLELYEHLQGCSSCLGRADFRRTLKAVVRSKWDRRLPKSSSSGSRSRSWRRSDPPFGEPPDVADADRACSSS